MFHSETDWPISTARATLGSLGEYGQNILSPLVAPLIVFGMMMGCFFSVGARFCAGLAAQEDSATFAIVKAISACAFRIDQFMVALRERVQ